jgi:hypothetical protein
MPNIVDVVAEAIWAMPSAKRVVSWESMDERVKDLWREDARRVIDALEKMTPAERGTE